MKTSWKTIGTLAIGMAFILGIQQVPLQKILNAQAQTVRMVAGPDYEMFNSIYLTPTSNSPRSPMPEYALPNMVLLVDNATQPDGPLQMDVNADGLLDFVYAYYYNSTNPIVRQYVVLNTGSGYNLVYVCEKRTESGVTTYKGDCAAQ